MSNVYFAFEFFDDRKRRIRCDFVSRPPRIATADLDAMFAAARGERRLWVVMELAREIDRMQGEDRRRMRRYEAAAEPYLAAFRAKVREDAPLQEAHEVAVDLAERLLPTTLDQGGS
jgi:hypothetical protein